MKRNLWFRWGDGSITSIDNMVFPGPPFLAVTIPTTNSYHFKCPLNYKEQNQIAKLTERVILKTLPMIIPTFDYLNSNVKNEIKW